MLTRRFGRTELAMPVFSCGGMRFQNKWQDQPLSAIPEASHQNLIATVHRAIELGIVHIETARGYGSSERQLGEVFPHLPREQLIVQTKIAPSDDPSLFIENFNDSLARLKLSHVDLLSLHGLNTRELMDQALKPGGCFEAAQELRRRGKARFIGFSSHAPTNVIIDGIRHGKPRTGEGFDYVNLHWYFIFQRNWPAIEEARARDMGVFIISPSDKGGKLFNPPPKLVELCMPLSPMVFNDLFCLSHPEVHTLSIGAARPTDFDAHLAALPLLSRSEEILTPILARLRHAMLEATGHEDPEAITRDLPEWHEAPAGLNLRVMLWLRNLALGWGLVDYGKARFNMLGNASHWFPGTKASALADVDPQVIARAVAASPYAARIPSELAEAVTLLGGAEVKRLSESD